MPGFPKPRFTIAFTQDDYLIAYEWAAKKQFDSHHHDGVDTYGLKSFGANEAVVGGMGELVAHEWLGVPLDTNRVGEGMVYDIVYNGYGCYIKATIGKAWSFRKRDKRGLYILTRRMRGLRWEVWDVVYFNPDDPGEGFEWQEPDDGRDSPYWRYARI